ncbi:MAG TPA: hypothetical protein DD424_09285 [Porphyromonadaceae bacterium]|nr:hypothetical protein [Porphyromonadaceae bacterium]
MIAKFKNRVDFAGVVNYANDHKSDAKRGRLIAHQGVCVVSNETIVDSFKTNLRHPDSRGRVHHLSQPVKHVSISFSPKDASLFPDDEHGDRFMAQLVDEWLHGMGITNAQYIVARHFDKPHPHCHLVFSRIDLDGNVISAFNERIRSAAVCKEIKLRHGLTFGNSSGENVSRGRLRPIQRPLFDMRIAVLSAAESSTSWAEFHDALESQGIEACFSFNRSTGEIRGISFAKDGCRFAGSKLSKQKLTYGKLAAKFGEISPMEGLPISSLYAGLSDRPTTIETDKSFIPSKERMPQMETPSNDDNPILATTSEYEPDTTLIPLSSIIELLSGGHAVMQSSGGGGTTNDLDWNDERRRCQEAQENRYIHTPFKRKR